jgi:hypothetical protein
MTCTGVKIPKRGGLAVVVYTDSRLTIPCLYGIEDFSGRKIEVPVAKEEIIRIRIRF